MRLAIIALALSLFLVACTNGASPSSTPLRLLPRRPSLFSRRPR